MPRPPQNPEVVEQRRAEIIDAAYRIFARKGYHSTNIADIAAELKIGHGTFYRYFRNKLDIFSHVLDEVIRKISEVVLAEQPQATDTLAEYREQTQRIGQRLLDLFTSDEHLSKLLFYEVLGIDEELNERVRQAMDVFGQITEQYMVNGREKGFLRRDLNTRLTAYAINAMIFEAARRILSSVNRQRAKEEWTAAITDLMIKGMGNPTAEVRAA